MYSLKRLNLSNKHEKLKGGHLRELVMRHVKFEK